VRRRKPCGGCRRYRRNIFERSHHGMNEKKYVASRARWIFWNRPAGRGRGGKLRES